MQRPPDPGATERKYRSRARRAADTVRDDASAGTARSDASTEVSPAESPHTRRDFPPAELQAGPQAQSQIQQQAQPNPPQAQPKLVRSGASSPVQRVDILLPRPPAPPPPPTDRRPPDAPPPPGKAMPDPAQGGPRPAAGRPHPATAPQAEEAGAARPRSRIQRDEKEFQLPKGFWGSLLIGVTCVAAITTLIVFARGWVGDSRQRHEGERRAESEAAERANYPLYYRDLIERYADVFDLDPALIAAVILSESSFDPDARSYVNARGLMQIMPDTGQWIAEMTGEPDFSLDRLYEAELNVRMGTWYLNYLAQMFDNDMRKVVSAYHAGQGNVAAWLRNPDYSSDGVTLDVIPTDDTRGYEARVQRAILVYQRNHFSGAQDGGFE